MSEHKRKPSSDRAPTSARKQPISGLAIASLVLGILGLIFFWVPFFGIAVSILAIVFGGIGISKTDKGAKRGWGLAVSGLTLGILATIFLLVLVTYSINTLPISERGEIFKKAKPVV